MPGVGRASKLAASLFPHRWLLLSGAVVSILSQGLATLTGRLADVPVRFFDPPGSALLVVTFPCLAGCLFALLFEPERGLARRASSSAFRTLAGGLALLAVGPVVFVLWRLWR